MSAELRAAAAFGIRIESRPAELPGGVVRVDDRILVIAFVVRLARHAQTSAANIECGFAVHGVFAEIPRRGVAPGAGGITRRVGEIAGARQLAPQAVRGCAQGIVDGVGASGPCHQAIRHGTVLLSVFEPHGAHALAREWRADHVQQHGLAGCVAGGLRAAQYFDALHLAGRNPLQDFLQRLLLGAGTPAVHQHVADGAREPAPRFALVEREPRRLAHHVERRAWGERAIPVGAITQRRAFGRDRDGVRGMERSHDERGHGDDSCFGDQPETQVLAFHGPQISPPAPSATMEPASHVGYICLT